MLFCDACYHQVVEVCCLLLGRSNEHKIHINKGTDYVDARCGGGPGRLSKHVHTSSISWRKKTTSNKETSCLGIISLVRFAGDVCARKGLIRDCDGGPTTKYSHGLLSLQYPITRIKVLAMLTLNNVPGHLLQTVGNSRPGHERKKKTSSSNVSRRHRSAGPFQCRLVLRI